MNDRANGRTRGIVFLVGAAAVACGSLASAQECEPGWSALGSQEVGGSALDFIVFDDGSGPALFAGGWISVGGSQPQAITRWDGRSFEFLGLANRVTTLQAFDDGIGPVLYAGGSFQVVDDRSITNFARWDGVSWTTVGNLRPDSPDAMAVYDDGNGKALFIAGGMFDSGTTTHHSLAKWDGTNWSFLNGHTPDGEVLALATYDDGSGPVLIVGGRFTTVDGLVVNHIARWDGTRWSAMGDGMPREIRALTVHAEGGRDVLYAAGNVAPRKWDPDQERWISLTTTGATGSSGFYDLQVFDDGRGPALYAAGGFDTIDGMPMRGLARFDGDRWEPLGGDAEVGSCISLGVLDDGRGPALIVSGQITIDGVPRYIARWGCEPQCPADFDADGSLTIFDFLAFQTAFDAGDPRADFDGDGAFTIFDFLAFQTAFDAGCE